MKDTIELTLEECLNLRDVTYCNAVANALLEKDALKDIWKVEDLLKLAEALDENDAS